MKALLYPLPLVLQVLRPMTTPDLIDADSRRG